MVELNAKKTLLAIINEDLYINPNFSAEMLAESYSQQFCPLFPNTYFIYDYQIVKQALKNPAFTTQQIGFGNYAKLIKILELARLELSGDVLFSDAAQHTRLKDILVKNYLQMYEHMPVLLEQTIAAHFAALQALENVSIHDDIATPLTEKIFLELSGLGRAAQYANFQELFIAIRLVLNAIDNNFSKHNDTEIVNSWEFVFYFVLAKVQKPDTSYPNLLAALQGVKTISDEEKAIMIIAFIRAGIENPRSFIVSAVLRAFEHPNLYQQSSNLFFDEVLRYDAPAKITARYLTEDFVVDGNVLPQGNKIWLSFRLANFNPDIFADPFEFKLRKPNPHLSLGFGPHFCIGKELTYRLTEQVINSILREKYNFKGYAANYVLDNSQVFRRYVQPLYISRD